MSSILFSVSKTLLALHQSFACFKSIKNENFEVSLEMIFDKLTVYVQDYRSWLKYWTVFGVFSLCELLLDLVMDFVPFYHLLKLLTLLVFVSPLTSGYEVVFQCVVKPLLSQRENLIEEQTEKLLALFQVILSQ